MNPLETIINTDSLSVLEDDRKFFALADFINQLILEDFEKLVTLLYRIDVSEKKLKTMLAEHSMSDAGKIIAQLIIDRQIQKIKTRNEIHTQDDASSEEERW